MARNAPALDDTVDERRAAGGEGARVCADLFFFNDTATTEIYTLSLHDALPISHRPKYTGVVDAAPPQLLFDHPRSEEHTSELQSLRHLVCRLLLEKKRNSP